MNLTRSSERPPILLLNGGHEPDPIVRTPSNSLAQRGPSTHESDLRRSGNPPASHALRDLVLHSVIAAAKHRYLSSHTSSMRQPLNRLFVMIVSPFSWGCRQVAKRLWYRIGRAPSSCNFLSMSHTRR